MKKTICFTLVALLLVGCFHLAMDKRFDLRFDNNSDNDISVSLTLDSNGLSILGQEITIKAHGWRFVYGGEEEDYLDRLYKEYSRDTLYWFVRKTNDNEVLQRYDMSLSDAKNVSNRNCFSFPPTEEMRNMKMWPSYGTYDEHGNRLK